MRHQRTPAHPASAIAMRRSSGGTKFSDIVETEMLTKIINRLVPYIPKSLPEGSASAELLQFLTQMLQANVSIIRIAETGFNTGASSRAFLSARRDTTVVSFDIGEHMSVRPTKPRIDKQYPGRHQLVIGDSTKTLPEYSAAHPQERFDLIFVDGGHDYEVAKADLVHFRKMSHPETIVVIDDL